MKKMPKDKQSGLKKTYVTGLSAAVAKARKAHWSKTSKMDSKNPAAYTPAPGDKEAKTKESKYTKAYKARFGEQAEMKKIEEAAGLAKKAKESGISIGTLRKVYNRGMAAWRTGHRPGTTPQQWAMARVNSYITKGKTYHTADKDLRSEGVEEACWTGFRQIGLKKKGDRMVPNCVREETKSDHAVVAWGRMGISSEGHQKLVDALKSHAKKVGGEPMVFLSHTQDPKKNPLSYDEKINYAQKAFGDVVKRAPHKTIIDVMKGLQSNGYKKVTVMAGEDRVPEFSSLLKKYNGREYNFDNLEVRSAGHRDPDAEGVEGMSASKLRAHAQSGNIDQFKSGLAQNLKPHAQEIMSKVRKGMNVEHFDRDLTLAIEQATFVDCDSELEFECIVESNYQKIKQQIETVVEQAVQVNEVLPAVVGGLARLAPSIGALLRGRGSNNAQPSPQEPESSEIKTSKFSSTAILQGRKPKESGMAHYSRTQRELQTQQFIPNTPDNRLVGTDSIRKLFQRMTPGQENTPFDLGQDKDVPQNDPVNLKRRNAMKRFKQYHEEINHDVNEVLIEEEIIFEEKKVTLNKPFRTPGGPKKFSVYVKNDKGNVVKVNFGDPNLSIKRDQPERRKAYRARHNCANPGPRWKANYWSCRMWTSKPVSDMV